MTSRTALLLSRALPFFLLACTGSVTAPPGDDLSVEEACRRVLAAAEQHDTDCGRGPWSTDVRAVMQSACVETGDAPGVRVNGARVSACTAAVPATMCLDDLPAPCAMGGPDGFLQGTVEPGGACSFNEECALEGFCGGTLGGAGCGRCIAQVAPGEACDEQGIWCVFGYECTSGVCTPRGTEPGGACTTYGGLNDCIDGYYCKPIDSTSGIDGTCSPRPATGASCENNVPCLSTDVCLNGVCATVVHVAPGAACDAARLCDAPALCFEGTCSVPSEHAAAGEPCTDDHDRCLAGLVCEDGICKERATAVGAACPCGYGLVCEEGACRKQEVGMPCQGPIGASCGPDLYCKGWTGTAQGTCAPRLAPGESCASAAEMDQYEICFRPYACVESGTCELIGWDCH